MANYWGRAGAPMIQPTKDEIRQWLRDTRADLKDERRRREQAEFRLEVATRKLGQLALEGKIVIPPEELGRLVLRMAMDEEAELVASDRPKVLVARN